MSDFREARCRAFHETRCNRGAYCCLGCTFFIPFFLDVILLMEDILHQLIGSLSHYLQDVIHPTRVRISSISSIGGVFCIQSADDVFYFLFPFKRWYAPWFCTWGYDKPSLWYTLANIAIAMIKNRVLGLGLTFLI